MKHEDTEAWQGRGRAPIGNTVCDCICAILLVTVIVCVVNGWM